MFVCFSQTELFSLVLVFYLEQSRMNICCIFTRSKSDWNNKIFTYYYNCNYTLTAIRPGMSRCDDKVAS